MSSLHDQPGLMGECQRAIRGQGAHGPPALIVTGGRWEGASPGRSRQVEERLEARGGPIDPAPRQRRVVPDRRLLAEAFHQRQRPVGVRGRLAETERTGPGPGASRARAGEQTGQPREGRRPAQREAPAATRGLPPASGRPGVPAQRPRAGRPAPAAASQSATEAQGPASARRPSNARNQLVAQAQRGVTRSPRPR